MNNTNNPLTAVIANVRKFFGHDTGSLYIKADGSVVHLYHVMVCWIDESHKKTNELMWALEEAGCGASVVVHIVPTYRPDTAMKAVGAVPFYRAVADVAFAARNQDQDRSAA